MIVSVRATAQVGTQQAEKTRYEKQGGRHNPDKRRICVNDLVCFIVVTAQRVEVNFDVALIPDPEEEQRSQNAERRTGTEKARSLGVLG